MELSAVQHVFPDVGIRTNVYDIIKASSKVRVLSTVQYRPPYWTRTKKATVYNLCSLIALNFADRILLVIMLLL